jgi:hypothetical protein
MFDHRGCANGNKNKTCLVELVAGILGWVWILAAVAALYFLVVAIFSNSPWSRFFWAFGIGAVAKWLASGFPSKTNGKWPLA